MTFEIAFILLFIVVSCGTIQTLLRERVVMREFNLSLASAWATLLLPIGPAILIIGPAVIPFPLTHAVAAACYGIPIFTAYTQAHRLDRTGTDRVDNIQRAINRVFHMAIVGAGYVAIHFSFAFGMLLISKNF